MQLFCTEASAHFNMLELSCSSTLQSPSLSDLIVSMCMVLPFARHLHCSTIALQQRCHAACCSFANRGSAVHDNTTFKAL